MTSYRLYLKACDGIGIAVYADSLIVVDDCFMFCVEGRCVVCISIDRVEKIQHMDKDYQDVVDFYDQAYLLNS